VSEATDLFTGMYHELDALDKRMSDNSLATFAVKVMTQTVQKGISVLTKRNDAVHKAMAAITTSLDNIPVKRELWLHVQTIEEQMVQVAEVNTGLTSPMEQ